MDATKKVNEEALGIFRMDITSATNHPMRVIHIYPGVEHPNHPVRSSHGIVEFYDLRYKHTPDGQFITRYNIYTLFDAYLERTGLDLYGSEPDWKVDASTMGLVLNWLSLNDLKRK